MRCFRLCETSHAAVFPIGPFWCCSEVWSPIVRIGNKKQLTVRIFCLVQPQQPIDEQLNQLKITARDKINELVDSSKQQFDSARNDPTSRYVVYYSKGVTVHHVKVLHSSIFFVSFQHKSSCEGSVYQVFFHHTCNRNKSLCQNFKHHKCHIL